MQQFKCIPAPAAGMENILGGVLTGIDADHLRAVLLKLAQEVGSERVIELCVEEAGIRGEPQWLAAMAKKASAPPIAHKRGSPCSPEVCWHHWPVRRQNLRRLHDQQHLRPD